MKQSHVLPTERARNRTPLTSQVAACFLLICVLFQVQEGLRTSSWVPQHQYFEDASEKQKSLVGVVTLSTCRNFIKTIRFDLIAYTTLFCKAVMIRK